MAELHILGHIESAIKFQKSPSLFCRYSFQSGPNWTIISGLPEGQTVSGKVSHDTTAVWNHPLDIHYITKGIQGWPKILLQVNCLDSLGRTWVVGYSCCNLPSVPGYHVIDLPCWAPTAVTLSDKIRQYFLGGSHQLVHTDIVGVGIDRFKLKTESKGSIKLHFDIILRNFNQFGVEYK